MTKPLSGYRFIELAGLGPAPYAGQLFADMGAEVILVNRMGAKGITPIANIPMVANRGKKTIALDLRQPEGAAALLDLVKTAMTSIISQPQALLLRWAKTASRRRRHLT